MHPQSILGLEGELTAPHANAQRERLLSWVDEVAAEGQTVQLDLGAVPEMDTAGAQLLIAVSRFVRSRGAQLRIVNASHAVLGVLSTYRLLPALGLEAQEASA